MTDRQDAGDRRTTPRPKARALRQGRLVPTIGVLIVSATMLLAGCTNDVQLPEPSTPPAVSPPDSVTGPVVTAPAAPSDEEVTPSWPAVQDGITLPAHVARDTGPRAGAGGEASVTPDGAIDYVVVDGDQLGSIAERFFPDDPLGFALNLISAVNDLQTLHPGDVITIPSGR